MDSTFKKNWGCYLVYGRIYSQLDCLLKSPKDIGTTLVIEDELMKKQLLTKKLILFIWYHNII